MGVARVEAVEGELNRMVDKRAEERRAANSEAAANRIADQRRREKLHTGNRILWIHHHGRMAEEHARLAAQHERRAQQLLKEPGGGDA